MARVMLVDDDPTTLDLVSRALTADGHQVVRCQDGHEALQHMLDKPASFDLLLTDVEMPGLDGLGLARRVAEAAPRVRILLMSGFAGGTDPVGAQGIPVAGFVSKPLSLDQIRAAVRAALA